MSTEKSRSERRFAGSITMAPQTWAAAMAKADREGIPLSRWIETVILGTTCADGAPQEPSVRTGLWGKGEG